MELLVDVAANGLHVFRGTSRCFVSPGSSTINGSAQRIQPSLRASIYAIVSLLA